MTDCTRCGAVASVVAYPCGIDGRGERIIRYRCGACEFGRLDPPIAPSRRQPDAGE